MCNVLESDRFWSDLKDIVKVFELCLHILRLADRECPAMDQLYFYVRKTNIILTTLKNSLNQMDDKYDKQPGPNIYTKMLNYFLRTKENEDLQGLVNFVKDDDDSDDDDESSEEGDLEDDISDDDDDNSESNNNNNKDERCGTVFENSWNKRSKALSHDVAISAWMCSPIPEVMADCKENHTGEHRMAVTRLLRKWFSHRVSLTQEQCNCNCLGETQNSAF